MSLIWDARFYLKCIEPHKGVIDDWAYSIASLRELEGWDSVMGLAFENLVANNYRYLLPHLHLEGLAITSAGPYLRQASKGPRGRQAGQGERFAPPLAEGGNLLVFRNTAGNQHHPKD